MGTSPGKLLRIFGGVANVEMSHVTSLGNPNGILDPLNPADVNNFAQDLASRLVGYMVVSYLENVQRGVVGIANLLGIIDYIPNPGVAGDPTHPPYTLRQLLAVVLISHEVNPLSGARAANANRAL